MAQRTLPVRSTGGEQRGSWILWSCHFSLLPLIGLSICVFWRTSALFTLIWSIKLCSSAIDYGKAHVTQATCFLNPEDHMRTVNLEKTTVFLAHADFFFFHEIKESTMCISVTTEVIQTVWNLTSPNGWTYTDKVKCSQNAPFISVEWLFWPSRAQPQICVNNSAGHSWILHRQLWVNISWSWTKGEFTYNGGKLNGFQIQVQWIKHLRVKVPESPMTFRFFLIGLAFTCWSCV